MTDQKEKTGALKLAEARDTLLGAVTPVEGRETLPIRAAFGRILLHDVIAPFNVPAQDNSAMDGYAARIDDLAGPANRLKVVGVALAGHPFSGVVGSGQAVRVMTGVTLPIGADCVVPIEAAQAEGDFVVLPAVSRTGQHVRRAGEDLRAGKPALLAGRRIGATELGVLASLGLAEVEVRRRPRIAFFSTGDELASIGRTLAPGEVYDSNRYTLHGVLARLGVEVLDMGVVKDEPEKLEVAFREAADQADAILTTGGVSVGEADYVKTIMARLGEIRFWKIDLKPGRPMAFGKIGKCWLFGLPGNPVAVMVTYHQIVQDALRKLQGIDPILPTPTFRVETTEGFRKVAGRREFVRGLLFPAEGGWKVRPCGRQGSGVLSSMTEANCFIVAPEDSGSVEAGAIVEVQPFEGLF
jgi:molybdopterin molybdotransferase